MHPEWNPAPPEGKEFVGIESFWKVLLGTAWRCWGGEPGGQIQRSRGAGRVFLLLPMLGGDGVTLWGCPCVASVPTLGCWGFVPQELLSLSLIPISGSPGWFLEEPEHSGAALFIPGYLPSHLFLDTHNQPLPCPFLIPPF